MTYKQKAQKERKREGKNVSNHLQKQEWMNRTTTEPLARILCATRWMEGWGEQLQESENGIEDGAMSYYSTVGSKPGQFFFRTS